MKLFLDDERPTPVGWHRVYWPIEAIQLLEAGGVTELSLDHDLGDDARGTGYDVIVWIEEAVALRGFVLPAIRIHSANPSAAEKMKAGVQSIERLVRERSAHRDIQR
ncbi:cyclic-phosphate processing receiver domain-containing protein [Paraburkholderia sp. EG287A]|uniref:cyclic-phosphate processing receiver domain-containing protein n=1 Tax=unclassified Paraburkholderia TaxID=2615204 RepID=UPI0034D2508A